MRGQTSWNSSGVIMVVTRTMITDHHDREDLPIDDATGQSDAGDDQADLVARDHSDADAQRLLAVEAAESRHCAAAYELASDGADLRRLGQSDEAIESLRRGCERRRQSPILDSEGLRRTVASQNSDLAG